MHLKTFTDASRFQVSIFNGKLHLEGRILSVTEAEAAGMASGLIIAAMAPPEDLEKIQKAKTEDDRISELLRIANTIKPEQMARLGESNDQIICKVIRRASMDGGESWENIRIVSAEEQQNAEENKLWVGVFTSEDRDTILNKALEGHREAADRIASFRKR